MRPLLYIAQKRKENMSQSTLNHYPPYSVLMAVYALADPEHFDQALNSMVTQTLPPDEITVVCDGPLTAELDDVLERYNRDHSGLMNIIRMPEHKGVGICCNIGLEACRNELVARMDSDDISEPDRCQLELAEFAADPSLDIVSGYILEFEKDMNEGFLRKVPTDPEETLRYARRRMPFSNVTIVYRKSLVQQVGGYRDLSRAEDYDLTCRMLMAGAKFKTLPRLMVRVRVDDGAFRRRKSWDHAKSLIGVRWGLYKMGFTSLVDFIVMAGSHIASLLVPERLIRWLYEKKLRTPYTGEDGNE